MRPEAETNGDAARRASRTGRRCRSNLAGIGDADVEPLPAGDGNRCTEHRAERQSCAFTYHQCATGVLGTSRCH